MKRLDEVTITVHGVPSLVLMERAALVSVETLHEEGFGLDSVMVICGPGNNGGDGVAIARLLHVAGVNVQAVLVGDPEKRTEETLKQLQIAETYGVPIIPLAAAVMAETPQTVVDALLGIGTLRAPANEFLDAVRYINSCHEAGARTLAIDIPTGVSADTGETPGEAVKADATVTFAYKKVGLTIPPGSTLAGKIVVKDIGIYAQDMPL